MTRKNSSRRRQRRGTIVVMVGLLAIPLLALAAFGVDYGYLLKTRTDLQRAADAAALAALQELTPAPDGTQDLAAARDALRANVAANVDPSFEVLDSDIDIGDYDPATIYSSVTILHTGISDTVRVTLRRDARANSPVALFFAPVLGIRNSAITVTATAVLQKGMFLEPGSDVLPFAIPQDEWDARPPGDLWSIYGDGRLTDEFRNEVPGNWGTVDIGNANNSTSDTGDQILYGLDETDLDALQSDGRIDSNEYIDSSIAMDVNGDPGLSAGMKAAVQGVHGKTRIVPIYDTLSGGDAQGNNVEFHVVGWGVVTVDHSHWNGTNNSHICVMKSYMYDSDLRPQPDLSNTVGVIEGAFTSPVLVE